MIEVKCSACNTGYKLPDSAAGRKARCKGCGEAMIVPDVPDDLQDDGRPVNADLSALYGRTDSSGIVDTAIPESEPVAFTSGSTFARTPESSSSGPPTKLIAAGVGGAVGLIAVVLVIVLVFSGGDEDAPQESTGPLAFNTNGGASIGAQADLYNTADNASDDSGTTQRPDTTNDDSPRKPAETSQALADPPPLLTSDGTGAGPLPDLDAVFTEDFSVGGEPSEKVKPDTGVPLFAPTSSSYGIVLPEGIEMISQTRVAVRTSPQDDGTWLSMEVHKLAGLDRRQASPITEGGGSVLLRGRQTGLAADVEVSEITSDHYTLQRLLYPVAQGDAVGRVAYVVKDGPYLISVLGRYPAGDDERLAMLDEAAKSVQPLEAE